MANRRLARFLVLLPVLGLALGACAATEEQPPGSTGPPGAAHPAGDGNARCPKSTAIAYVGTIDGQSAALGQNILQGVRLAVKQHNDANENCQVRLEEFETRGDPERAPGIVSQLANYDNIVGAIGLPFSGEYKAAGQVFDEAGLVSITPSATNPYLSGNGWQTFFRALGTDNDQGQAAVRFITENLGAQKVCVVSDDSEYGQGLSAVVAGSLGEKLACEVDVRSEQFDFSGVIGQIKEASPDAVYYAGYYQEAGPFARQLHDQNVDAQFVGPDGVRDPAFLEGAGEAAENAYFTCPCVPGEQFAEFNSAYEEAAGAPPGAFSPEAYDSATILLKGIDAGHTDRAGLLNFVSNYEGQGLTKWFSWNDRGDLTKAPIWTYKVAGGKITPNVQLG